MILVMISPLKRNGEVMPLVSQDIVLYPTQVGKFIRELYRSSVLYESMFYSANKSIVGYIIPEGYEPYTEFRPDEEISTIVGPSAIAQRMTASIIPVMGANKVIVELKRKIAEIYNS